jgi:KUP system potassium uptake protein
VAERFQLGYLPRLQVRPHVGHERGQIYIPEINYILLVLTLLVVGHVPHVGERWRPPTGSR